MKFTYGEAKGHGNNKVACYGDFSKEVSESDQLMSYIYEDLELGVVGYGKTEEEALDDWKYEANNMLEEYKEKIDEIRRNVVPDYD